MLGAIALAAAVLIVTIPMADLTFLQDLSDSLDSLSSAAGTFQMLTSGKNDFAGQASLVQLSPHGFEYTLRDLGDFASDVSSLAGADSSLTSAKNLAPLALTFQWLLFACAGILAGFAIPSMLSAGRSRTVTCTALGAAAGLEGLWYLYISALSSPFDRLIASIGQTAQTMTGIAGSAASLLGVLTQDTSGMADIMGDTIGIAGDAAQGLLPSSPFATVPLAGIIAVELLCIGGLLFAALSARRQPAIR